MNFILYFSDCIIPCTIFYILIYAVFHHTDVYECFQMGVKDGFKIVIKIAPTMLALMVSIGIFRISGALALLSELLEPLGEILHIPSAVIPVILVRIFSSSAATSFVLDIFKEYGPNSKTGMMVSIMMGCTETVIYTITVYFAAIQIRKTRWVLPGALFATLAGVIASVIITEIIM
ncbi:MAG: spore maturation protein [Clostridiales bacterium]|nr:spore maturation protein [Clostridiales bacterium]